MSFQNASTQQPISVEQKVKVAQEDLNKLKNIIRGDGSGTKNFNALAAMLRTLERRINDLNGLTDEKKENQQDAIAQLVTELRSCKPDLEARIQTLREKEATDRIKREQQQQQQVQVALTEEDLLREQLEFMHNQTQDIVHQMKEINEIQNKLYDKIKSDSEIIVKIDHDVEEAKDDMIAGNEQLEAAEKHLKKTCNVA